MKWKGSKPEIPHVATILLRTFVQGRMRINRPWHAEALQTTCSNVDDQCAQRCIDTNRKNTLSPNSKALTVHILPSAKTVRLLVSADH